MLQRKLGHLHVCGCACMPLKSMPRAHVHLPLPCPSVLEPLPHWIDVQHRLERLGFHVSSKTCSDVLHLYKFCKSPPSRKQVCDHIVESVHDVQQCLDNLLVQIFIDKGLLPKAYHIACNLHYVSILVWNCLIGAYAQKGMANEALHVIQTMYDRGTHPDKVTFLNAMSACSSPLHIIEGKALHIYLLFCGCESDVVVNTCLATMYSRCGSLQDAVQVFENIDGRNVVSWTAMIGACTRHGHIAKSFHYFEQMKQEAVMPNRVTFLCYFDACSCKEFLVRGKQLHSTCPAAIADSDINLMTSIVNMYDKCGSLEDARNIFMMNSQHDVVLWNAVMAAFLHHREINDALQSFHTMQQQGVIPNSVTYVAMISACATDSAHFDGKRMHAHALCCGFEDNIVIATSLINMYGKCGNLEYALCLFDSLKERSVVAWNTIIMLHAQRRHVEDVVQLVDTMHQQGVFANEATYVAAVEAYATPGALAAAKEMHFRISICALEANTIVATAIATMYCRCNSLDCAWRVFKGTPQKSIVSWNLMVSACGHYGWLRQAFRYYDQMQSEGMNPDQATYASILSVCTNQLVLLTLGAHVHNRIIQNGYEPDVVVATSLLNMYGKCGSLEDACKIFKKMSTKNVVSWNVMISVYSQHGCAREAICSLEKMQQERIIPNQVTFIVVISACSHAGMLVERCPELCPINMHGVKLSLVFYHCIIDLLGRAGLINEAKHLIYKLPLQPSSVSWVTFLGACRNQTNIVHGTCAAKHIVELDQNNTAALLMLEAICVDFNHKSEHGIFC